MNEGINDGIVVPALAMLLCTAVLLLFASSLATLAGVDVPVVSGWIHGDEARQDREWRQTRAEEEVRNREAASQILEAQR